MSVIKCTCKSDCKTELNISGNEFWFTDNEGKQTLMYLDANKLVELIQLARNSLLSLTEEES